MLNRIGQTLNVIVRNLVRVGAQRREFQTSFHRLETEGIAFDGIKKIFPSLLGGKKIVGPGAESIAPELPGVAMAVEAHGFREMQAVLPRRPRQQVRSADAVDDIGN